MGCADACFRSFSRRTLRHLLPHVRTLLTLPTPNVL
jgi:hypothetical protein